MTEPAPSENSSPPPAASKPRKAKGRWGSRIRWTIISLLTLLIFSRLVLVFLLPAVLRHVAGYYGLDASYERLELSLLSGNTGLWHLVIRPKTGGDPIASIDYCRGDVSTLNLLRGRLVVWRVEADGVNLAVDRDADGSVPLLKLLARNAPQSSQPTPAAVAKKTPARIDLSPPLRLDALRLSHIKLHLRDKAVTPALDTVVSVDVRLSDFGGHSGRPTYFTADLDADPFLDALHVTGEGSVSAGTLHADFSANVNGLRLRKLSPYLAAFGLRPMSNETTAHAAGDLTLGPSPADPNVAAAKLDLKQIALLADGEEAAGLDDLTLDAPSLSPGRLGMKSLVLQNVRLHGRRTADGNLRFAGLEYVGVPAARAAAPPLPATATGVTAASPFPVLDLPLLDLRNLSAHFHDDAVIPAADVSAQVDELSVSPILIDPAHPDASITLRAVARLPGIAGNAHLDGSLTPMATTKSLSLRVAVDQITPSAIAPYLAPLGITTRLHNATFAADLHADATSTAAGIDLSGSLSHVALSQDGPLLAMDHVRIDHARIAPASPGVQIADVSISGPALSAVREVDGSFTAAGVHFDPRQVAPHAATPSTAPSLAAATTAPQSAGPALPAVAVQHFRWDGIDVRYDDLAIQPPLHTRLADAALEYKDARFSASARVPNVIENLTLTGTAEPLPQGMHGHLTFDARGIDSTIVTPFLKPLHLQPTLHDGSISATADAAVAVADGQFTGTLTASGVRVAEGSRELAGVDGLSVKGVRFSPRALRVDSIDIDHPRATVTLQHDGNFAAAGLRLLPTGGSAVTPPTSESATTPRPTTAAAFDVALEQFHVGAGSLRFVDEQKSTDTTATADISLQHLSTTPTAPALLSLKAAVTGVVDRATVDGTVTLNPAAPAADLAIAATNLRAGQLKAYLPANIGVPLHDGTFRTHLLAGIGSIPAGGNWARLVVTDLDYRQANDAQPLLKLDSARLIADRVDPHDNVFAVSEVSTAGIELSATRAADGSLRALGVQIAAGPAGTTATPKPPTAEPTSPQAPLSLAAMLAQQRRKPLKIQLKQLDLGFKRLTVVDEARPAAAPLTIENARFRNLDPIDWGGPDPDSKPPTHFRLDAGVLPAMGSLAVQIAATPLASQPTLSVDVLADGINGDGVLALLPELKPKLNGHALTAGQFHLQTDATLRFSRRGDSQVDFTGPLEADLDVKPITFRVTPAGPVLLGLDELHSDGIHVEPNTGTVHIKTVELTNPVARVTRETDGLHALGVVLKLSPSASSTTQPAISASAGKTTAPLSNPATAPAMRPTKPTGEIRLDRLVISDCDIVATDNTVNPPLVVPLNSLDVEVRDFTNLAPYEDKPLKFKAVVNAGKVPLPKPLSHSGLGGAFSDAAKLMAGKAVASQVHYEDRELFSEIAADGSIGLYPAPTGYIKASVGGFELASLTSTAAQYGVSLSDGVFDSTLDAKLPGDGSIQTRCKFVITDLGISEPPNGPIFRYLHLPAPLDAVVGVLQDSEGSITVPLDIPVKNGTLSADALAGPAVSAFGSIVTTAIASTPFKAANGLTDLLGMGGKKSTTPEPPLALPFEPGDVLLSVQDRVALSQMRARLIADPSLTVVIKHVLGGGDVADAQMRANPSPQEAEQLAQQLRQQQLATAQLRSNLAGVLRSDLERGAPTDDTQTRLREVDQQMADADSAMDRLFDMLRPGADRLAPRRTRQVCLGYGKQRLAAVHDALDAAAPADLSDRIHVLTPQYTQPPGTEGGLVIIQLVGGKR